MAELKVVLAQINPTVGDLEGNAAAIRLARSAVPDADLIVFPELIVSGYPPEDMVLRPAYAAACRAVAEQLALETKEGPAIIIGSPWPEPNDDDPRPYNAALLCDNGQVAKAVRKIALPDYGVFDEPRTFRPGRREDLMPVAFRGSMLGIMTCEDMWVPGPATTLAEQGAQIFIVPHGSPFRTTVHAERLFQAEARVRETGVPLIFVNQVGGQDQLVFDGGAFVCGVDNGVRCGPLFEESLLETKFAMPGAVQGPSHGTSALFGVSFDERFSESWPTEQRLLYPALVLATRDYVRKSGFESAVLGLSGGIDSAMVATIAVDALGSENVHCVMLPSRYTSADSLEDARACAEALGVRYDILPIEPAVEAFSEMLAPLFERYAADTTEENLQSRIRGTTLMALSNKFGSLLLSTGNKSEMGVGYATLYGDMNGAFNPLKDVYKTAVFELAAWRNRETWRNGLGPAGAVIPDRILRKPPSAELREGQRDDDSLPAYEVLDTILRGLVEEDLSVPEIAERGFDVREVARIQQLLHSSEYKRAQSPPGPKVTSRNFGRDRRYPIVNKWRDLRRDPS